MIEIEGLTKKWGTSSLAFVIPKDIVKEKHLKSNQKIKLLLLEEDSALKKTFGILRNWKKPTQQIMKEMDEELWNE